MKTINKNTKAGRHYMDSYNSSNTCSLYGAYTKPSAAKERAYRQCLNKCGAEGGWGFRIIGYNSQCFSAAWLLEDGSLRVETAYNSYIIK